MEPVGLGAVDRVGAGGLRLAEGVVEQLQAVLQGVEEGDLFLADHALNPRDALLELGVRLAHHLGDDRHDLRQERVAAAHLVGVEHGPTEQPTQDVALLLVPRADILVDAERQGPRVVGHPPDADAGGIIGLVGQAERVGDAGDDRLEDVGAEDRRHALQAGRGAFQAHTGVDVLLRQRLELPRPHAVELREDEVPDLDFLGPVAVIEDLGAGAADAVGPVRRGAGGPEVVVLAHPGDPVGGELDLLVPDVEGLVVVEIDGDGEPVGLDLQRPGQELPGPVDRLALEVVAEAEIAEHLEERLVERRHADVLDVPRAQALLAGRRAGEARVAQAHELALELVHPGRCEEHGRVVGHEQVARLADAALRGEEVEVGFAQFVGRHGRDGHRKVVIGRGRRRVGSIRPGYRNEGEAPIPSG